MPWENDVFISYAHEENQPVPPDMRGWVDDFEAALTAYLARTAGDPPRIWRDSRLERTGELDDHIREALRGSAMLLCILSRAYVKSPYCRSELREFVEAFKDDRRLVKVVTATLPDEKQHPPPLNKALGYPFFKFDERQKTVYDLDPLEDRGTYRRLLYDIARDIANRLTAIAGFVEKPKRGSVYLAHTGFDMSEYREALRSELESHDFRVLPDRPLGLVKADCEAQVRNWLTDCRMAVHLIGNYRGGAPDAPQDESNETYVELQVRETSAYARGSPSFSRLVWMPAGLAPSDAGQRQFVARLRHDPVTYDQGDLLQGSFEEFKAVVLGQLMAMEEAKPVASARLPRMYLIYEAADEEAITPIDALLGQSGIEIRLPVFEGDEEARSRDSEQALSEADWAVIYWGAGTELWANEQLTALRKYERRLPIAVCLAPPVSPRKQRWMGKRRPELVVSLLDGFSETSLRPLVNAVGQSSRAVSE